MTQELSLAKKVGMTQVYLNGQMRPVTVLKVGPCKVLQVKDGALVVELDNAKGPKAARQTTYAGAPLAVGDSYAPSFITQGSVVDVVGISKGRGYTGVIKKHGFSGLGAAHGVKKVHRSGGSVGQNTEPGRVHPGTEMAGRHGADRVTVRNLKVASYDPETGVLAVVGAVPGARNGIVVVRKAVEPPRSLVN